MNARTLALAAGCMIATGLAGCSSDQNTAPPPPPPAPAPLAETAPPPPPPAPVRPMPSRPERVAHAETHHANTRVEHIQTALNSQGAHLEVDGTMGPKTVAALKSYQKAHKLKVTGKPDSATLKTLGV
jgi:peptidoglycan hydrolase-like protein with peptidoglycan-binding domain